MTTETGSPPRHRMIDDMVARKLVPNTQRGHVFTCRQFAADLGRSPETATPDDVRNFQRHLIDEAAPAQPGTSNLAEVQGTP